VTAATARLVRAAAGRGVVTAPARVPVELARLRAKVDVGTLTARGWDQVTRVFAPPADDPLFGYHPCEREGCTRAGAYDRALALGLCDQCACGTISGAFGASSRVG